MLCLGQADHFNAFSVELNGVLGGIVHIERTLNGNARVPLLGWYLLTPGTKHPWNQSRKRVPGLLEVQPKDWQLVFIFSLQGSGFSRFIDNGSSDPKPNYICTKQ